MSVTKSFDSFSSEKLSVSVSAFIAGSGTLKSIASDLALCGSNGKIILVRKRSGYEFTFKASGQYESVKESADVIIYSEGTRIFGFPGTISLKYDGENNCTEITVRSAAPDF